MDSDEDFADRASSFRMPAAGASTSEETPALKKRGKGQTWSRLWTTDSREKFLDWFKTYGM